MIKSFTMNEISQKLTTIICHLFSYFNMIMYVSSNFTLDLWITEFLQCHIDSQINFDFVKFQEHWEKEFLLESMFWAKSTLLQTFLF